MAYPNRKNPWQNELWNVSLLPTGLVEPSGAPPAPRGSALRTPALLSETAAPPALPRAA